MLKHNGSQTDASDIFYSHRNPFEGKNRELIIEEILNGRIVLTYYYNILALAFLLVCLHYWINKYLKNRHAQLRQEENNFEIPESNELRPTQSTRSKENSPLLSPNQRSKWNKGLNYAQGTLMHQPHNLYFEDNGTMIVILIYHIVSVGYLFWDAPRYFISYAFRLGSLCVANVPLMYIFGAKHSPISFLTGWSYEQLNVFHRHVGRLCVITFFFHTVIFLVYFRWDYLITHAWSQMGVIAGVCFFAVGLTSQRFLKGLNLRDKMYEVFYAIHGLGMVLALPAIYFHYHTARAGAVIAALSVLYDRVYRMLYDYRSVYAKVEVLSGDTIILRLPRSKSDTFLANRKPSIWSVLERTTPLNWSTGQHVFISIPGCQLFQSHPFTIASSPEWSQTMDLIIRAKGGFTRELYDQEVAVQQGLEEGGEAGDRYRWVVIHGPYGTHPLSMPEYNVIEENTESCQNEVGDDQVITTEHQKIVLVGGGAGVAFTWPLYQDYLYTNTTDYNSNISSGSRSANSAAGSSSSNNNNNNNTSSSSSSSNTGGEPLQPHPDKIATIDHTHKSSVLESDHVVIRNFSNDSGRSSLTDLSHLSYSSDVPLPALELHFLWIIPYRDFTSWIPDLVATKDQALESYESFDDGRVVVHKHIWVTREEGRPDIESLVKQAVRGAGSTASVMPTTTSKRVGSKAWVATCGPDYMVRGVRNAVADLVQEGEQVDYYAEKFGW